MTTEELIAAQFYAWEKRGRGWLTWDYPVELEPPFVPFPGYYLPARDDGRKSTALSRLSDRFRGSGQSADLEPDIDDLLEFYGEHLPEFFIEDSPIREIRIALPTKGAVNREAAERFLISLRTASYPISFEVVGLSDETAIQFACRDKICRFCAPIYEPIFPTRY